ncbi:hypothetical protein AVEN_24418-1 [Araneus ventricosus]|uniref:Uncharacterized protein n=1 Tax=Araneus ventricosus TaxID=182803 RepID=A0A4Y2MUL4_ARAVE|nr:hypothetical protein AVEN_24418-1 [Araneus ventricosus]
MDSEEYSESDSSYEGISDESDSDEDTLDAARNCCRIDQENLARPPPRFPFSRRRNLQTKLCMELLKSHHNRLKMHVFRRTTMK